MVINNNPTHGISLSPLYQVEQSNEVNNLIYEVNGKYIFGQLMKNILLIIHHVPTKMRNMIQVIQFLQVPKKNIMKIRLEL